MEGVEFGPGKGFGGCGRDEVWIGGWLNGAGLRGVGKGLTRG